MLNYVEFFFIVAIVGLIFLMAYVPWQWYWADWYRQRLFEIRDDIFDLAVDGEFEFGDENYRAIRESLEMHIRFAHEATWTNLSFMIAFFGEKNLKKSGRSKLEKAIRNINDPELRKKMESKLAKAAQLHALSMAARSPAIWIILLVLLITMLCRHSLQKAERKAFRITQVSAERYNAISG